MEEKKKSLFKRATDKINKNFVDGLTLPFRVVGKTLGLGVKTLDKALGAVEKVPIVGLAAKGVRSFGHFVGNGARATGTWAKGAVEGIKNKPFAVELKGMIEILKQQLIQIVKKLLDSLQKQSQETGQKLINGEKKLSIEQGTKEGPVSPLNAMEKTNEKSVEKSMDKAAEKITDKTFGLNGRADVTNVLENAKEKAAPGGLALNTMDTPNLGGQNR